MKQAFLSVFWLSCLLCINMQGNGYLRANDAGEDECGVLEESGKDSCLIAYLTKHDSQYHTWDLVFENKTQDTLLMMTHFRYDRFSSDGGQGFMVYTYSDRRSFMQEMETYQKDYYIFVQDTARRNAVRIPPHSKVSISFDINNFISLPLETMNEEIGVQLFVKYFYRNTRTNRGRNVYAVTNYLPLNRQNESVKTIGYVVF